MANEKRLIDANKAQAVLVNMAEHLQETGNPEMAGAVGYAAEVIGKQKTVDAVEVVRCKECKSCMLCYPEKRLDKEATPGWFCKVHKRYRKPDDFCSYGERREGE